MIRILPTIKYNDKDYYVDARQKEIRAVNDPYDRHDYFDLNLDTLLKVILATRPEDLRN